jgi:dethiobiotin synthetase/adenosylmethionine--8-amino-7-oxononanoate aminotransferase
VGVIGLKGSYHGDTIGAMDASEPSTFNERVHWYKGRGYWFDFPQVKMVKGRWIVEPPKEVEGRFGEVIEFSSLAEIFDIQAMLESPAGSEYREHIQETLDRLIDKEGMIFGALVMEV